MKWIYLCVLFSPICFAQHPLLQLQVSHEQSTERAFSGIENFNLQLLETHVKVPLLAISSFVGTWYGGFHLSENRIGISGDLNESRRFYRFALPLEYEMRKGKRFSQIWRYTPAYYSDESIIDQSRYVNEFAWIGKYKANRKVHWVAGIVQDTRFGVENIYVTFGLESRPNAKMYHHWVFPDMYSEYTLNKKVSARLFIEPDGGKWRYLQSESTVSSFSYTNWRIGLAWLSALRRPLQLKIEAGMGMLGEASVAGTNGDLDDNFFFQATLQTRLLK